MILHLLLIITGFILLIKGADFLVEGASAWASRLGVSEIVIGLTVVSFGTSAPELLVNVLSSFQGRTGIAFGNVIGSNIVNILLILGIAGLIRPLQTRQNTIWKEIPFSLVAVAALILLCNDAFFSAGASQLSRGDGLILLLFFIIFMVYVFGISRVDVEDKPSIRQLPAGKTILFMAGGLIGLAAGGQLVVSRAVIFAEALGLSQKFIGLTLVSIGTSLPELFTSSVAAYRGKNDIAIGNVVGSNIFNILFVLSLSGIIMPLPFETTLNADLLFLSVASVLLFFTMFTGKKRKLDRWEAALFLIIFLGYQVFLFIRG
ncbi:MAG: calcium/sodium antiporter [Calditrichia bacterium]